MQKSSREQIRNNHSLLKSEASKRGESTLLRHSQLDPWNSQIQITTRSLHWFSRTALGAFCFGIQCLVSALKHEFWWDGCIPSVPCIAHCSNPLQDIFALLQNGADLEKGWWSEPLRHAWPDKQDCASVGPGTTELRSEGNYAGVSTHLCKILQAVADVAFRVRLLQRAIRYP